MLATPLPRSDSLILARANAGAFDIGQILVGVFGAAVFSFVVGLRGPVKPLAKPNGRQASWSTRLVAWRT